MNNQNVEEAWGDIDFGCSCIELDRCTCYTPDKEATRSVLLLVHIQDCWACRRGLTECQRRRRIEALP